MIPIQFPSTLGFDFSRVVEKIGGSSVSQKEGDEVCGQAGIINGSSGVFAEMALANVDGVVHKPKSLNHQEAAGLPTVGVSAWQALVGGGSKDRPRRTVEGSKDADLWWCRRYRIYCNPACKT
jgi:NADPH:quinone reductase-like Zn-dependent oxidoreductase